jgi:hypothetical protein
MNKKFNNIDHSETAPVVTAESRAKVIAEVVRESPLVDLEFMVSSPRMSADLVAAAQAEIARRKNTVGHKFA